MKTLNSSAWFSLVVTPHIKMDDGCEFAWLEYTISNELSLLMKVWSEASVPVEQALEHSLLFNL